MKYKNVDNGRVIDIPSTLNDKKWLLLDEATSTVATKKKATKKTTKKEG